MLRGSTPGIEVSVGVPMGPRAGFAHTRRHTSFQFATKNVHLHPRGVLI